LALREGALDVAAGHAAVGARALDRAQVEAVLLGHAHHHGCVEAFLPGLGLWGFGLFGADAG
jgi:hypothetical protein